MTSFKTRRQLYLGFNYPRSFIKRYSIGDCFKFLFLIGPNPFFQFPFIYHTFKSFKRNIKRRIRLNKS